MNAYRPLASDDDVIWIIEALALADARIRGEDE